GRAPSRPRRRDGSSAGRCAGSSDRGGEARRSGAAPGASPRPSPYAQRGHSREGDADARELDPRQALGEEQVREEDGCHRIERAEHGDECEESVPAREREERVRADVRQPDGDDGSESPVSDAQRGSTEGSEQKKTGK